VKKADQIVDLDEVFFKFLLYVDEFGTKSELLLDFKQNTETCEFY